MKNIFRALKPFASLITSLNENNEEIERKNYRWSDGKGKRAAHVDKDLSA